MIKRHRRRFVDCISFYTTPGVPVVGQLCWFGRNRLKSFDLNNNSSHLPFWPICMSRNHCIAGAGWRSDNCGNPGRLKAFVDCSHDIYRYFSRMVPSVTTLVDGLVAATDFKLGRIFIFRVRCRIKSPGHLFLAAIVTGRAMMVTMATSRFFVLLKVGRYFWGSNRVGLPTFFKYSSAGHWCWQSFYNKLAVLVTALSIKMPTIYAIETISPVLDTADCTISFPEDFLWDFEALLKWHRSRLFKPSKMWPEDGSFFWFSTIIWFRNESWNELFCSTYVYSPAFMKIYI